MARFADEYPRGGWLQAVRADGRLAQPAAKFLGKTSQQLVNHGVYSIEGG